MSATPTPASVLPQPAVAIAPSAKSAGGSRSWISYSPYFGAEVGRFYDRVVLDD